MATLSQIGIHHPGSGILHPLMKYDTFSEPTMVECMKGTYYGMPCLKLSLYFNPDTTEVVPVYKRLKAVAPSAIVDGLDGVWHIYVMEESDMANIKLTFPFR